MAEDVCDVYDSWEDIIENGVLDLKLSQMNVARHQESSGVNACTSRLGKDEIVEAANSNAIKILKRPANGNGGRGSTSNPSRNVSNSNKSYDLNNYVNSEPFVPQNYPIVNESTARTMQYPQITLEDTTRTQYVPQVKILKRPKEKCDGKLSPVKNSWNHGKNTSGKSYEEREAEYAKARLRILGSAVPTYDTGESSADETRGDSNTNSTNNGTAPGPSKANGDVNRGQFEVPIIRMPQGPDGSKGFTVKR